MSEKAIGVVYRQEFDGKYRVEDSGAVRPVGHRKNFEKQVMQEYLRFATEYPDTTPQVFKESIIERLEDNSAPRVDSGCTDLDQALEQFFDYAKLEVSYDQIRNTRSHRLVSFETIKSQINVFCWEQNQQISKDDTPYAYGVLADKFKYLQDGLAHNRWVELRESLKHKPLDGGIKKQLFKILKAIGCPEERKEMDCTMLVHWMWCVKRRFLLNDYRPSLPLMMVLSGPQGAGKSSFVETILTEPFQDKTINTTLDMMHDKREVEKFTNNLVINFDELTTTDSKKETADLLKNLITLGHLQGRVMYSTAQQKMEILCTLTATTNKHLSEVVRDETGARRYWVLETAGNYKNQFDWETLEDIDWLALWKGIDENRVGGYFRKDSRIFKHVEKVQNTYCISPIVKDWFLEHFETYSDHLDLTAMEIDRMEDKPRGLKCIGFSTMYEDYVQDMKAMDTYTSNQTAFHRMLEKMGVKSVRQTKRYSTPNYLVIKKDEVR